MPSQVLFLFDLDECFYSEEIFSSSALNSFCLKILLSGSSYFPSKYVSYFSFRFYSSSGRILTNNEEFSAGTFSELCESSWAELEITLADEIQRIDEFRKLLPKENDKNGRAENLKKALEQISALYNWDTPTLNSPIKKGGKLIGSENDIYVFTRLPKDRIEHAQFFGSSSFKRQVILDSFTTRNILSKLSEDEVSLFIVDMSEQLSENESIKEIYHKTLRFLRGGLLSFYTLFTYSTFLPFIREALKDGKSEYVSITLNDSIHLRGLLLSGRPNVNELSNVKVLATLSAAIFTPNLIWTSHIQLITHSRTSKSSVCLVKVGNSSLGIISYCSMLSLLKENQNSLFVKELFSLVFTQSESENQNKNESYFLSKALQKLVQNSFPFTTLSSVSPSKLSFSQDFQSHDLESWRIPETFPDVFETEEEKEAELSFFTNLQNQYSSSEVSEMSKRVKGSFSVSSSENFHSLNSKSRGAELLRLGHQRFADRNNDSSSLNTLKNSSIDIIHEERNKNRVALEHQISPLINSDVQLLAKLMELQIIGITSGDELYLVSLAEITIGSLLQNETFSNLEQNMRVHFLVDPLTITRRKTSLKKQGRIRDHQLQVLYRIELHWLLPSKEKQEEMENEILIHLRQISIWSSPEVLSGFLNETLAVVYSDRQSELLIGLYEELNVEKPQILMDLMSSPLSSIAPSSLISQSCSEASSVVLPSVSKMKRVKRHNNFDNGIRNRTIILGKQGKSNKETMQTNKEETRKISSRTTCKGRTGLHRVKRNLSFDNYTKSPRKKLSTPKKKTPLKLGYTPKKKHSIYVPETPKNKIIRRKSDGNTIIHESPESSEFKDSKTTPRRIKASLALHRKTSFYSGNVSRNLQKAEEIVNANKIKNSISIERSMSEESHILGSRKLFPHLSRKRLRSDMDENDDSQLAKNQKIDIEIDLFSPSKRVQFNMIHQPPTPIRKTPAKSILKTPLKTPNNKNEQKSEISFFSSSKKTPSKKISTPTRLSVSKLTFESRNDTSKTNVRKDSPKRLSIRKLNLEEKTSTPIKKNELQSCEQKSNFQAVTNESSPNGSFKDSCSQEMAKKKKYYTHLGTPKKYSIRKLNLDNSSENSEKDAECHASNSQSNFDDLKMDAKENLVPIRTHQEHTTRNEANKERLNRQCNFEDFDEFPISQSSSSKSTSNVQNDKESSVENRGSTTPIKSQEWKDKQETPKRRSIRKLNLNSSKMSTLQSSFSSPHKTPIKNHESQKLNSNTDKGFECLTTPQKTEEGTPKRRSIRKLNLNSSKMSTMQSSYSSPHKTPIKNYESDKLNSNTDKGFECLTTPPKSEEGTPRRRSKIQKNNIDQKDEYPRKNLLFETSTKNNVLPSFLPSTETNQRLDCNVEFKGSRQEICSTNERFNHGELSSSHYTDSQVFPDKLDLGSRETALSSKCLLDSLSQSQKGKKKMKRKSGKNRQSKENIESSENDFLTPKKQLNFFPVGSFKGTPRELSELSDNLSGYFSVTSPTSSPSVNTPKRSRTLTCRLGIDDVPLMVLSPLIKKKKEKKAPESEKKVIVVETSTMDSKSMIRDISKVLLSPEKIWSVGEITESPSGEIKLKIKKKAKKSFDFSVKRLAGK